MYKTMKKNAATRMQNQKGFTLVEMLIVLVLIGLAVALMVGIFGNPFSNASIDSAATRVIDDLRSIEGAAQAYKVKEAATPADIAALVTKGYLKTTPVPPSALSGSTYTMALGTYKTSGEDMIATLDKVKDDICKAINKASYGTEEILSGVAATKNIQCYGTVADQNTALIPVFVK
jgi:prepilin-type N-terminal cleavage/methylation domain-containing protein